MLFVPISAFKGEDMVVSAYDIIVLSISGPLVMTDMTGTKGFFLLMVLLKKITKTKK